jgi:hypothetical protein
MKKFLFGILAAAMLVSPVIAEDDAADVVTDAAQEIAQVAEVAVKARETAPASGRRTSPTARVSLMGAGGIRSAASGAPAPLLVTTPTVAATADLECDIGEYPRGGTCATCDQKNNPGVRWANSGKDCKIAQCVGEDYVLVDSDKEQPKCVQKCSVWGGTASREWSRADAEFSFCGSGKFLECENGFAATRERTSSSGTDAGHCVVVGTMTGACKDTGKTNTGKFANGQCMQVCENGYWSGCTISRFCESGYAEDNYREVILVRDKKDTKASAFDCIRND